MIIDTNLILSYLMFLNRFFILLIFIILIFLFKNIVNIWFDWNMNYLLNKKKIYYYICYIISLYLLYKIYNNFFIFFFINYTNISFLIKIGEKRNTIEVYEFLKLNFHIYQFFQKFFKKYCLMFQYKNKKNIFNNVYLKNKKKHYIWHLRFKNIRIEYVGRYDLN